MTKRVQTNPLVKVKVVPFGDRQWGVAGTLDGARTFFNYVVGDQAAAKAEAERQEKAGRNFKPDGTR